MGYQADVEASDEKHEKEVVEAGYLTQELHYELEVDSRNLILIMVSHFLNLRILRQSRGLQQFFSWNLEYGRFDKERNRLKSGWRAKLVVSFAKSF